MTTALERRLEVVERRMGVRAGPFADLSDADVIGSIELLSVALAEAGDPNARETLAREGEEEARLRSGEARGHDFQLETGWRWPCQRARARSWERGPHYSGPRSAATPEALARKIQAALPALEKAP